VVLLFASCKEDPFEADSGTFTDKRDNHMYEWVIIGEQIWMAENLAYMPYACGPDSQCGIWVYGYYGSGSFYETYTTYGCLYDWKTALEVCPDGWHLPSDEEWMELELFLGMDSYDLDKSVFRGVKTNAAGKLKSNSSDYWDEDIRTNETGFSALPGGRRDIRSMIGDYSYQYLGKSGTFWTNSEKNQDRAINRCLRFESSIDRESSLKTAGFSVRCIKN
jgi:uncharacterized protein (TIGR02145 family)